ncbi:hypothetical protein [Streptomyces sp. T028]|uniref:hypothetical protein n=1 Tax=Streptomyces sp. T028 TaxID=3394379 RepID=UPI003A8A3CB4
MTRRVRRRYLMGAALLATVLFTMLALRTVVSAGTTDSASGGTTLTGGTARDVVTVTVASPETGMTAVDVRLTPRGTAASAARTVTVSAVLPTAGHAVPEYTAERTATNRYHVPSLPLMMPGRWEVLVEIDGGGHHDRLVFPLTLTR